jgi:hypothetical protein
MLAPGFFVACVDLRKLGTRNRLKAERYTFTASCLGLEFRLQTSSPFIADFSLPEPLFPLR